MADSPSLAPEKAEIHAYYHLEPGEARFFESLCELIVPDSEKEDEPGANRVGAVNYIDSTLFELPAEVQGYFRSAIKLVDEESTRRFSSNFADLGDSSKKSIILRQLYLNPKTRERMLDLRSLALEGFYSDYHDPWYSGTTAWEFVGFQGKRISDLKKDWSFLRIWRESAGKKNNFGIVERRQDGE